MALDIIPELKRKAFSFILRKFMRASADTFSKMRPG
jgi:hypothetical protein